MKYKVFPIIFFLFTLSFVSIGQINKRLLPYYDTIVNKFGYYNISTNKIIKPEYEYASFFIDDHAVVKGVYQSESKIIDTLGNVILTSSFDDWAYAIPRKGKLAVMRRNPKTLDHKWGVISLKGDTLVPFIYSDYLEEDNLDYFVFRKYDYKKDDKGELVAYDSYVKINAINLKEELVERDNYDYREDTLFVNDSVYLDGYRVRVKSLKYNDFDFQNAIVTEENIFLFSKEYQDRCRLLILSNNSSQVIDGIKLLSFFDGNFLIERRVLSDSLVLLKEPNFSVEDYKQYVKPYFLGFRTEVYDSCFKKIELDTSYNIISDASENWFLAMKDSSLYFLNSISKKVIKACDFPFKESLDIRDLYNYSLYARFVGGKTLFFEENAKEQRKYFLLDTLGNKKYLGVDCFPAEYYLHQGDPDLFNRMQFNPVGKHLPEVFFNGKSKIVRAEFYFQRSKTDFKLFPKRGTAIMDTVYPFDIVDYEGNVKLKNVYNSEINEKYEYDDAERETIIKSLVIESPSIVAMNQLIKINEENYELEQIKRTDLLVSTSGELFFSVRGTYLRYNKGLKLYEVWMNSIEKDKEVLIGYVDEQGSFYYPKLK